MSERILVFISRLVIVFILFISCLIYRNVPVYLCIQNEIKVFILRFCSSSVIFNSINVMLSNNNKRKSISGFESWMQMLTMNGYETNERSKKKRNWKKNIRGSGASTWKNISLGFSLRFSFRLHLFLFSSSSVSFISFSKFMTPWVSCT